MGVSRGRGGLRQILSEVDFPADKETIVTVVQDSGADQELLSAVQAIPPAMYQESEQVLRAVPLAESEPESHTEAASTNQRSPVNPIEEELGENPKA